MYQTLDTSLIYFKVYPIRSNPCQNIKSTRKYFSWIFSIFTDVCLCAISISILPTVWRFVLLLPPQDLILSRGSTYWLIGSTQQVGCLPTKALKCQVNRYMRVKQKSRMASLLSVFTYWGGGLQCLCTIQTLIFFVVVILGSIYSQCIVFSLIEEL